MQNKRTFAITAAVLSCFVSCTNAAHAQTFGAPRLLSNTTVPSDRGDDQYPDVAGDSSGNWVAVWESTDELDGTIGTDADILVARSSNNGASWSKPAPLNSNAAIDGYWAEDVAPRIATDGYGRWIVVWSSKYDLATGDADNYRIHYSISDDNGQTWTPAARLSSTADTGDSEAPQISTDGSGNWVAVWQTYDTVTGDDLRVSHSANNGSTWSRPVPLNTTSATDNEWNARPDVSPDGNGDWIAVWEYYEWDGAPGWAMLFARSFDGGATWTAPAVLEPVAGSYPGYQPQIATDGTGNCVVVFQSAGATVKAAHSTDHCATWSSPVVLNPDASDVNLRFAPHVTTNGSGVWLASWLSNDGEETTIVASRSVDAGVSWTAPVTVGQASVGFGWEGGNVRLASDGNHAWLAVWCISEDFNGPFGGDADIFSSVSLDDGATWSAAVAVNSAAFDFGGDSNRVIATDRHGNWIAVWDSSDDLGGTIGRDRDLLVRRSSDNGQTWSTVAPLNTNAASDTVDDQLPVIVTDGEGNWLVVWTSGSKHDSAPHPSPNILSSRSTDNGATWSAPQIVISYGDSETPIDPVPRVATDGAGNWIAVWQHGYVCAGSGWSADLWYARSTDAGVTWSSALQVESKTSCKAADGAPDIASDGMGHWAVVFTSYWLGSDEPGRDEGILISHSSDSGASWTPPAPVNADATSSRHKNPKILADGSGRWLAAWNTDVVYYTISEDDGASWRPIQALDPHFLDNYGHNDWPNLASDGAGTWIVSWTATDPSWPNLGWDSDVMMAKSHDGGDTWSDAVAINANAAVDIGDDSGPRLAGDGQGNWIAVWRSEDPLGGTASYGVPDTFFATSLACPAAPLAEEDCLLARTAKLHIIDTTGDARDSFAWQWARGEAFSHASLGDPTRAGGFAMCLYDRIDTVPQLAASWLFEPDRNGWIGSAWGTDREPRGWRYDSATANGRISLRLQAGRAGRTRARLTLKGGTAANFLPGPSDGSYFAQNPSVIAQLSSPAGPCWTSEFDTAVRNTTTRYLAVVK